MKLTSMKCEEKSEKPADVMYGRPNEYPYGLQIRLDEESIKKLAMETLPDVGAELTIHAKVKVCSVSSYETEQGQNRGLELQITDLAIGE